MEEDSIPIIDLSPFLDPGQDESASTIARKQKVSRDVRHACEKVGFMYLKNHGIPSESLHRIFSISREFFSQPAEIKNASAWSSKESNTGYVGVARERLDPTMPGDLKEAYNMSRPELMKWPDASPAHFKQALIDFFETSSRLALCVLDAFALALDLPPEYFRGRHGKFCNTLRLLHYPPISNVVAGDQVAQLRASRAGAHSDYGSITLLVQDDVGGLQVQRKNGEWFAATPIPDTILVNTGDLMARWSNDLFKSTVHRVAIPESREKQERDRYSIALFCHPDDEVMIECLPTCSSGAPPKYPPISALDYLLWRLQQSY